tara:strand:+ start:86 stop:469 length:384 start_codon:yes stop_codon:yes gene_type:complete
MELLRKTDYGTYWMTKEIDENLSINVECFDDRYDSKLLKEKLKEFYDRFKEQEIDIMQYELVKCMIEGYIEYVELNDGKIMDTEEIASEVTDGCSILYEGTTYDDAINWIEEYYWDLEHNQLEEQEK